MENFNLIRERILGAKAQQPSADETPGLESEVSAALGGANAEPPSLERQQQVDVAGILDKAAEQNGQQLDWRNSVEDLLRVLGADPSLNARAELADELGYPGEKSDLNEMDVWLRKALLYALSENGGKVPPVPPFAPT